MEVSPTSDSLAAGVELPLVAVARDTAGAEIAASFTWTSSDTALVVVSSEGVARGVGFGTARVTARAGGASGVATLRVVERARRDRPDVFPGAQIHVLYAASPALDRSAADMCDLVRSLRRSLANLGGWLARSSNIALPVDEWRGPFADGCPLLGPDVSVLNLDGLAGPPYDSNALLEAVVAAGFAETDKIYAVYVEGRDEELRCGLSIRERYAFVYLRYTEMTGRSCGNLPMVPPSSERPLGAVDLVLMHEILHLLGAVHLEAPNGDGDDHVADFDRDLMFHLGPDLEHAVLDVNCDDYYGHAGTGDILASPYLRKSSLFLPTRCSKTLLPGEPNEVGFGDPID